MDGIRSQLNFGWTFDSYWLTRKCPNHKLSLGIILQYFPVGLHQGQRNGTQKAGDRAGVLRDIIYNIQGTFGARQGLSRLETEQEIYKMSPEVPQGFLRTAQWPTDGWHQVKR